MKFTNDFLLSLIFIALIALINSQGDKIFKCPNNYYKTPKAPSDYKPCPSGSTLNSAGYCDCQEDTKFFDVLTWTCEECPEDSIKDLNSSSCICIIEGKEQNEDPNKFFNIITKKCETRENPPCGIDQFLDFSDYKCHLCGELGESDGFNTTQCICQVSSFWNEQDKQCQECKEGTYSLEKGATSCICSGTNEYWNKYYQNCTNCPNDTKINEDKTLCECNQDTQVFIKKENKCIECPKNTDPKNNECICQDEYYYFDYGSLKCVHCRENSYRKIFDSNVCDCYDNYITIEGSCFKCPNGVENGNCKCKEPNQYFDKDYFDCLPCPKRKGSNQENDICGCDTNQININGICYDCPSDSRYDEEKKVCECYDENKIYDISNNVCTINIGCTPCENDEMSDGTKDFCYCKKGYFWDYSKKYCVRIGKNAKKYFSSKSTFIEIKIGIALLLLALIF